MCGIAGLVKWSGSWKPDDALHRNAMLRALAHRGPDGHGQWLSESAAKPVALLHTRLAIIDRAGGTQPMPNEDGNVHVVFNGEIYNHLELRQELIAAGHRFVSDHSDTEVLVHGWEQWGTDLPAKLLGMFAFAIWDSAADTLFLARDRMGQKPLFYSALDDGLVFASTLPAVLAWPEVPRRVPREQISLYLQLGYLPPPMTIYRDISQVVPGHFVRLRGTVIDGANYWKTAPLPQERIRAMRTELPRETFTQLRATVESAVDSQLMADVPLACFLSGGVDSSIIAEVMQQAVKKRGGDSIQTISVGFKEAAFDETQHAAQVARRIGSRHTRLEVDARQNVMATLEMLMAQGLGQPFADSSILPTYHLSVATRHVAPVALSGDGADELFGGYDRYRAMLRLNTLTRALLRVVPVAGRTLRQRERMRRLKQAARGHNMAEQYTGLTEIFSHEDISELLGPSQDWVPPPEAYGLPPSVRAGDYAMCRDQAEYLPGDVLWKVDTASMAVALEVRSPFLDHRVVELARSLSASDHMATGRSKEILKLAFGRSVLSRPKQGFAVPMGDWFRGNLREPLWEMLRAKDGFCTQHLNMPTVERLLLEHDRGMRDHTHRLFALLMLEIWWRQAGATVT